MEVRHFASPQENIKCVWIEKENTILEGEVLLQGRISNCTRCWMLDILSGQKWHIFKRKFSCKISWSSISYELPAQLLFLEGLQNTFEVWQIFIQHGIFKLASHWITKYFVHALRRALYKGNRNPSVPETIPAKRCLYSGKGFDFLQVDLAKDSRWKWQMEKKKKKKTHSQSGPRFAA